MKFCKNGVWYNSSMNIGKEEQTKNISGEQLTENEYLTKQIAALSELLAQRDAKITQQQSYINDLLKRIFGRKSEKLDPNQLLMQDVLLQSQNRPAELTGEAAIQEEMSAVETTRAHKRKSRGRMPLPEHLERKEKYLDIDEKEKICKCCGKDLAKIGEEITERLEYRPLTLAVNRYIRPKYACSNSSCDGSGIQQAEAPACPIQKSEAESSLLAHIITEKFEHHNPLYRQQIKFERLGIAISRTTLSEWMFKSAYVLIPVYELMCKKVLINDIVLNDDTPVDMLEPGLGKTRIARLWCTVGGENLQYTVYNFTRGRGREGPEEFFKDYKGYFVADAYGGYGRMFAGNLIIHVGCWAHARRYFVKAQDSSPRQATQILVLIAQLYKIEAEYKHRSVKERLQARQKDSVKILEKIKTTLEQQRQDALPKSALGEAIDYTLRLWKPLCVYTTDGRLPMDNNLAENGIRPIALGRKNWLFVGSENGGRTAAILLSFCVTCRKLKIDTWEYLNDVLQRINDCRVSRLAELLPDNWKRLRAKTA